MSWTQVKLNDKYREFIMQTFDSTFNVIEGSWRSGKTTALLLAHILYLDDLQVEGLHIAAAESISTAKTILLDNPAGFTYKGFFVERAEEGKFEGKEALVITNSKNKKQTIIFAGSSKSDSFKSIRGLTAMSFLCTEINLAHKTFVAEAIGRTISTSPEYRRIFADLNPKSANDWFYSEFLDVWASKAENDDIKLNYLNTTYYDNPVITEDQKIAIQKEYDPDSLLYKIYILGQRISQADHVYILRPENLVEKLHNPVRYIIIVDPGISSSSTVAVTLEQDSAGRIGVSNYYHHKGGSEIENLAVKNYRQYALDMVDYYKQEVARLGGMPQHVFIDNDIMFFRELTTAFNENNIPKTLIKYAVKKDINTRIQLITSLLYKGKLVFKVPETKYYADQIQNLVYDNKKLQEEGKLVREDKPNKDRKVINPVDFADPLEYGCSFLANRGD